MSWRDRAGTVSSKGISQVNIYCHSGTDNIIDRVKINIEGTDNKNIDQIRLIGLKYVFYCQ
jgi:hypothetical protein